MASGFVAQQAAGTQVCRFAGKAPSTSQPAGRLAASRLVVRAEEGKVAKSAPKERTKDTLYFASEQSLGYLDGSLPADYGFDPLGLSDPDGKPGVGFVDPAWLRYSEVFHARWAMLGAAGCIAPEILASAGVIPQSVSEVTWFKTGVIQPAGSYDAYWSDPWSIFYIEVIAMQFAELRRLQDYRKPGSMGKQYFLGLEKVFGGSGDPAYPGGPFFNILGFGKNDKDMKDLKTKELKNGRLAMLAMLGYGAQAVMTQQGPWANLQAHLSSPFSENILTNLAKVQGQTF